MFPRGNICASGSQPHSLTIPTTETRFPRETFSHKPLIFRGILNHLCKPRPAFSSSASAFWIISSNWALSNAGTCMQAQCHTLPVGGLDGHCRAAERSGIKPVRFFAVWFGCVLIANSRAMTSADAMVLCPLCAPLLLLPRNLAGLAHDGRCRNRVLHRLCKRIGRFSTARRQGWQRLPAQCLKYWPLSAFWTASPLTASTVLPSGSCGCRNDPAGLEHNCARVSRSDTSLRARFFQIGEAEGRFVIQCNDLRNELHFGVGVGA
jgi:hypothetical protein